MTHVSSASTSPASGSATAGTRFLLELENTCAILRVYGEEHPAFRRSADAAAANAVAPLHISISSKGLAIDKTAVDEPSLARFSKLLRRFGLIGLDVETRPTASQITSLVIALGELERAPPATAEVIQRIAQASGGAIKAIPLRLDHLRLVEGRTKGKEPAAGPIPLTSQSGVGFVWRELFSSTAIPSTVGPTETARGGPVGSAPVVAMPPQAARQLAQSFERSLGPSPAPAQWGAMVDGWVKQLAQAGISPSALPALAAAATAQADAPQGGEGQQPASGGRLDAVSSFLEALSPHLCQRLMAETVAANVVSESVVLALAQRLPPGIVLGALSAVDRNNAQPSQAALALLRKVSSEVSPDQVGRNAPRTNDELVQTAASLERLLQSDREGAFVPDEYLRRRQELSRAPLLPDESNPFAPPDERETARHAADVVFQMLSSAEAEPGHAAAGLEFLKHRLLDWTRCGNFSHAAEALSLAHRLCVHEEPSLARAAREVVSGPVELDDLLLGAKHCVDRGTAVRSVSEFLQQCHGGAVARLLASDRLLAAAGGATDDAVVFDAMRHVMANAPDYCMADVMAAIGDEPPPVLLAILSRLDNADILKAVQSMVRHCSGALRRVVLRQVFERNIPWPLPLTEQLLKDEESGVRRLAMMRLVRDNDAAVAAGYFEAASRSRDYAIDVCLGLAELLRPYRKNRQVRQAYRRWFWSRRRWGTLFSLSVGGGGNRRRAS
jgi:hypothetical protein